MTDASELRPEVTGARRVVVKVGSSSLTSAAGGIDPELVEAHPHQVVDRAACGSRVVDDHQSPGQ